MVTLVHYLSVEKPRRTGTNSIIPSVDVVLPPGARVCQPEVTVPAGSGRVGFAVNTNGQPSAPIEVEVTRGSERIARTAGRDGSALGIGRVPVRPVVRREVRGATVCARNRAAGPVTIYGDRVGPGANPAVGEGTQQVQAAVIRVDWFEPEDRSWWTQAGTVADRFWLAKATFFGPWTMWLVLALLVALGVAAVGGAVREARR